MQYDSAIFVIKMSKIIIICHVDDLIIAGPDGKFIDQSVLKITKYIKLGTIGNVNQFIGMQILTDYKSQTININQKNTQQTS